MEIKVKKLWQHIDNIAYQNFEDGEDAGENWACNSCGIRFTEADNFHVSPEDCLLGSRIYFGGHFESAGPHNKVFNLTTKNGLLSAVLTQTVFVRRGDVPINDYCCLDSDTFDEDWDEEDEE